MSSCTVHHWLCIFYYCYYFPFLFCPTELSLSQPTSFTFLPPNCLPQPSGVDRRGTSERLCGAEPPAGLNHNKARRTSDRKIQVSARKCQESIKFHCTRYTAVNTNREKHNSGINTNENGLVKPQIYRRYLSDEKPSEEPLSSHSRKKQTLVQDRACSLKSRLQESWRPKRVFQFYVADHFTLLSATHESQLSWICLNHFSTTKLPLVLFL